MLSTYHHQQTFCCSNLPTHPLILLAHLFQANFTLHSTTGGKYRSTLTAPRPHIYFVASTTTPPPFGGHHSPLSRLVNSSCCFSFHSFFGFIRLSWPSQTRSTRPPCLAMTLFTRLAKSMADSFSPRVIGGRYHTSHTIAHEVIIMYRYCIIE